MFVIKSHKTRVKISKLHKLQGTFHNFIIFKGNKGKGCPNREPLTKIGEENARDPSVLLILRSPSILQSQSTFCFVTFLFQNV
jgi:hypothetical protein